jgi:hypothetical protein
MSKWRELNADEKRVLYWLLTRGAELTGTAASLAVAFLPQVARLKVIGQCDCGCASIDLSLDSPDLAVGDVSEVLADVEGRSPEGVEIGLILRAKRGCLVGLEAYSRESQATFTLPKREQLAALY